MRITANLAGLVLALGIAQVSAAGPEVETKRARSTWLFVETRPRGAEIELDGQPAGRSEGLFAVRPGVHRIAVRWEGHPSKHEQIRIAADRITRLLVELDGQPGTDSIGVLPPSVAPPGRLLLVQPRPRYSVLNLPWGSVPPAGEPPAVAILEGHQDEIHCVEFSPGGRILASAGADNTVRLWSIPSGRLRHVLEVRDSRLGVSSVAFSPDGKTLASCAGKIVRLWDPETGSLLLVSGELGNTRSVAFSADGNTLAVATSADSVVLCDTGSLEVQSVLRTKPPAEVVLLGHDESVCRIAYSWDGKLLACGGGWHPQVPGRLTVWDTGTASLLSSFETSSGRVRGVAFSPDAKLLAYATGNTVRLVDMARLPRPHTTR